MKAIITENKISVYNERYKLQYELWFNSMYRILQLKLWWLYIPTSHYNIKLNNYYE